MNISIVTGQIAKVHVKLETEEHFELYGGTDRASFDIAEERLNEFVVTVREEAVAGKPLSRYNVYVRQPSSGREWVVLSGKLLVSPRTADISADKLAPIEYKVIIPVVDSLVDLTGMAIVTGIIGPRGWSAYEIAVQEGFEGTESEWLEHMRQLTATLAVEQVTPLMERAEDAAGDAEREAAAAKTEQETAAAHAAAAKESELAAAGHAATASDEAYKARQEQETAAGHANAAAERAQDALANQQGAEQAAQDAALSQVEAEKAKTNADAAKIAAQTSESNAKASADAAAADKTAAEQAKQDALAAQTKAEEEAQKAEQNAALLGDAALQSGNNTFTGLNTFSGEVSGVLPWDFHAYSWCKTVEEFRAVAPDDLATRTSFAGDFSSMQDYHQYGEVWVFPNNIRKVLFYYSGTGFEGRFRLGFNLNDITIIAPNLTNWGSFIIGQNLIGVRIKNRTIITPHAVIPRGAVQALTATGGKMMLVCKNKILSEEQLFGTYYSYELLSELKMPLNVVERVEMERFNALKNVPVGFPYASYINMNAAKLNKSSVLAILTALQPYDAATMTTVPELTLGIDPTLDGDEEINAALLNAQTSVEDGGKGWNVAVNGFTITAGGGATMALRKPVYAARKQDAEGVWVDAEGTRWSVRYGNTVLENWAANEELGYTEFPTIEAALEEWGLTEYVPEPPEESLAQLT